MSGRNTKRLMLHKETLRNLQDSQLRQVVGGTGVPGEAVSGGCGGPSFPCVYTVDGCPCASSITNGGTVQEGMQQAGAGAGLP